MSGQDIDFFRLFESMPTPFMVLDRALCFVAANQCYLGVTASKREELIGRYVFDAFPESEERVQTMTAIFQRTLAGEENVMHRNSFAIYRPDAGYQDVYWDVQHAPVRCDAGNVIGILQHAKDVTAEVNSERMRDVISQEYDHRVRNILAKVSAIAHRTAREAQSMQQFIADFDPRIQAMARAHQLLVKGGWENMGLRALVESELKPYAAKSSQQISITGDNLALGSRAAQALGMALHELTTNAVKYGALKMPSGRLDVRWTSNRELLHIDWIETGLTNAAASEGAGFGSTIIDRILPAETGGTVTRVIALTGLVCTIDIPLPQVRVKR